MVHRREVNGQAIVLGNQGALWGNAMTWWDHDTGSIWSQPTGEAIAGPRKGETVELLPSTFTTWRAWVEAHPDTLALDVDAGVTSFDLEEFFIVTDFGVTPVAYPVVTIQEIGVINDTIETSTGDLLPVAVVADPTDPQRWAVFSRQLDDRVVELAIDGTLLVDAETGTTWDPVRGIALDGPLSGEVLDHLPALTSFPDDYPTFWPDGEVWQP